MATLESQRNFYRRDIDGLRAIAILAVIINHYNSKLLPSGFLGVDVFFVISGFVITASLATRPDQSWKSYLLGFYSRRVKRLAPALVVCIVITSVLGAMFTVFPRTSINTGIFSLFGASNFYLYKESIAYFGKSTTLNLFTHTWSLGVEEQFYLFFPILLGLCGFARMRSTNGRANLLIAVSGLSGLSLWASIYLYKTNPLGSFFWMPARFWELGLGCLIYAKKKNIRSIFERNKCLLDNMSVASLVTMIGVFFLPEHFRLFGTIAVALLTGFIIDLMGRKNWASVLLSKPTIVKIGLLSYSLYLWHWPILTISRNLIGFSNQITLVLLILTLGVAHLSYRGIEVPLQKMSWWADEAFTIVCGLWAFFLAIVVLLVLAGPLWGKFRLVKVRSAASGFVGDSKCHNPKYFRPIDVCLRPLGNPLEPRIFLMGDSHAANLLKGLELAVKEKSKDLRQLTDIALSNQLLGQSECGGTACDVDEVGARINFLKSFMHHGDILVFSMSRDRIYSENDSLRNLAPLSKNLSRLISSVQSLGGKVLLVEDIPKVCTWDEYQIWMNGFVDPCRVSRKQSLMNRQPLSDVYSELQEKYRNVSVFDPHPIFCPTEECSNFLDGKIIYTDGSPHLTVEASKSLSGFMLPYLK